MDEKVLEQVYQENLEERLIAYFAKKTVSRSKRRWKSIIKADFPT